MTTWEKGSIAYPLLIKYITLNRLQGHYDGNNLNNVVENGVCPSSLQHVWPKFWFLLGIVATSLQCHSDVFIINCDK